MQKKKNKKKKQKNLICRCFLVSQAIFMSVGICLLYFNTHALWNKIVSAKGNKAKRLNDLMFVGKFSILNSKFIKMDHTEQSLSKLLKNYLTRFVVDYQSKFDSMLKTLKDDVSEVKI